MVRSTGSLAKHPIEVLISFAHHYRHGPLKRHDQLFFYSTDKATCEKMLVFGGKVYEQRGGWAWIAGKTDELVAIAKIMQSQEVDRQEIRSFINRMIRKSKR